MPNYEAIYFLTPSEESVDLLMDDFKNGSLYKGAHVYFTEAMSDNIFKLLSKSEAAKKLKSLVEVNISFTAYESKVFTLDLEPSVSAVYSNQR